jgi:hypothetical protein
MGKFLIVLFVVVMLCCFSNGNISAGLGWMNASFWLGMYEFVPNKNK